jgi:hypothetical protein
MLSLATAAPFGNAQCERSATGQQRRLATDGQARERRAHSNPAQRCSRNIKRAQERPFSESEVSMTRAEVFALTVKYCDAVLEKQLRQSNSYCVLTAPRWKKSRTRSALTATRVACSVRTARRSSAKWQLGSAATATAHCIEYRCAGFCVFPRRRR